MAENEIIVKKKAKVKQEKIPKLMFAVRIRGSPGMNRKVLDTMKMLRMHKLNHGVLVWGNPSYVGMLNKCKDFIAYGEIDEKTLIRLLRVRGRVEGNKPLTDEEVKNLTKYSNIKTLAKALFKGEVYYNSKDLYKIKPVFRLHPPKKGHKGNIKKHYNEGGSLGYVEEFINQLIHKML